ncbi:Enolase-phosphatase E1 [Halotydeus destructor]|nr:Enolase-phosphatase E1 [Halotydeus destructor]
MTKEHPEKPSLKVYKPQGILVNFVGVIVSDKWKEDTVKPFALENLKSYLEQNQSDSNVLIAIESLRTESTLKRRLETDVPEIEDDNAQFDAIADSVMAFVRWQHTRRRLTKVTEQLEKKVIEEGLTNGKLKTHVYKDVPAALKQWKRLGFKVFIDAPSLSSEESKLYLKNTVEGDLAQYFDGYFGNEPEYKKAEITDNYAAIFQAMNVPLQQILYVTFAGKLAKSVSDVLNVDSMLVDRHENRKTRTYYLLRFVMVNTLDEIQFVERK